MKKSLERPFPSNIEAEEGVLGSLIIDPEALDKIISILQPHDFYRDAHRVIYQTILSLRQRRTPADYITLCDELERIGKIEEIGGAAYITSLINSVPTSGNIGYYADIVVRLSGFRQLIAAGGEIVALAYAQVEDAQEQAEALLFALRRGQTGAAFHTMRDLVGAYLDRLSFLHEHRGTLLGVTSGFRDIDMITNGFQKSDSIILAGRPAMGKSSLGGSFAYNAAAQGKQVAIFSLEMSKEQLTNRLMSMITKINQRQLSNGWVEDEQWGTVIEQAHILSEMGIYINDLTGNPIESMRSQLRELESQHGPLDEIIVDYLQLVHGDNTDNRVQEISKISKGLKDIAREFQVPVISLAQLSRKVEDTQDKRPHLSHLKESGSIEEDADIVMFIYREDYYAQMAGKLEELPLERHNVADIIIAKHRNGSTGEVSLYFKPEQTMFYNLEKKLEEGG